MRVAFLAVGALALAHIALAHMCVVYPPQRGGVPQDLSKHGNRECAFVTAPCGGTSQGPATAYVQAGAPFQALIQKNLDHFNNNPANPGWFQINWSLDGKTFYPAIQFADDSSPSGTIYSITQSTPDMPPKGNLTLQFVYLTNNANAPAAFYQCADLQVI